MRFLKAFFASACGWRSLLEKMGNTIIPLGKSGECCGVMLEFKDVKMTSLLNWWQMRRRGLSRWLDLLLLQTR
ncbi:hypothetical protein ACWATR_34675 [Nostoc sp. UIC 10890]